MALITGDFDSFLWHYFIQRAVERLVALEAEEEERLPIPEDGTKDHLLARIRVAARMRRALDLYINNLIVNGNDARILANIGSKYLEQKPTWKEIGTALGTSPQAAHRKYHKSISVDSDGQLSAD